MASQFGQSFFNARRLQQNQQELQSAQNQKQTEQLQKTIDSTLKVANDMVANHIAAGGDPNDPNFQKAVNSLINPAIKTAQMANNSGYFVTTPDLVKKSADALLMSPTLSQQNQQAASQKKMLARAQAEGTAAGTPEQPASTKAVWDKSKGQRIFATEEEIANNPNYIPITEEKTTSLQAKTFVNPQTGESTMGSYDAQTGQYLDRRGQSIPDGFVASSVTGGAEEVGIATKTQGTLEDNIIQAQDSLANLEDTMATFEPEFLTLGGKAKEFFLGVQDKALDNLSEEQKDYVTRASRFKQNALENLNVGINILTGAQMSEGEAKRLRPQFPDPENDGPTEFLAKTNNLVKKQKMAIARYRYMKDNGLSHDFSQEGEPPISLDKMEQIMLSEANNLVDAGVKKEEAIQRVREKYGY